jgi:hypothetical protein
MWMKLLGITNVVFGITEQRLIKFSATGSILEKKWENNGTDQPFIDFKKAYDSVRGVALYNILTEFGIPRKLVGLIEMC